MKDAILVPNEITEGIRAALGNVLIFLDAMDIADSAKRGLPDKRNSAMTIEVRETLAEFEELCAKHALAERDEEREQARRSTEARPGQEMMHGLQGVDIPDDVICRTDEDHQYDAEGFCIYCGLGDEDVVNGDVAPAPDADE